MFKFKLVVIQLDYEKVYNVETPHTSTIKSLNVFL